nr:nucleobase:cation symporter-2 family protein [Streptomyces sp. Xyl84]
MLRSRSTFSAAASPGAETPGAETAPRPEDERLPARQLVAYGFQHILTMYGGIIAPPLIVGGAAGLSGTELGLLVTATIFVSGLATLLQTLGVPMVGAQLPLVQGATFAAVSTMTAIATRSHGLPAVFGATIAAGLVGLVVSMFFGRVVRFFPPVVTGTVIAVIGLTLLPVAFGWASGGGEGSAKGGSMADVGLAGATLLIILVLSRAGKPAVSRLSILLGIVLGTVLAAALGKADFSGVTKGATFALPEPLAFGAPRFDAAAVISMVVVVVVVLTETTADIIAVGEIVGTEVDARRIGDGLRADMISTSVSPLFGGFACTAFAQNVGLVALTRIKSRYAVAAGGGIMVVLGLFPVLGRVVAAVPLPVLGGAGLVLFGSVAASGVRTLSTVRFDNNLNLVVVATAVGFGLIPVAAPHFWDEFPHWFALIMSSGISAASVVAVLLNLLFNETRWNREDASVFAAAPPKGVIPPGQSDTGTAEQSHTAHDTRAPGTAGVHRTDGPADVDRKDGRNGGEHTQGAGGARGTERADGGETADPDRMDRTSPHGV